MSDKPILFSGEMVRAILEGRKTQTRRVFQNQPCSDFSPIAVEWYAPLVTNRNGEEEPGPEIFGVYSDDEGYRCPYGAIGDRLWVRESWNAQTQSGKWWHEVKREDRDLMNWAWTNPIKPAYDAVPPRWLPSIHMPREASRITLGIVNVRVERVRDITWQDIAAEGCPPEHHMNNCGGMTHAMFGWFEHLWEEINGPRGYGWNVNPWVWVVEFEVV